jgi:hypothetical protein
LAQWEGVVWLLLLFGCLRFAGAVWVDSEITKRHDIFGERVGRQLAQAVFSGVGDGEPVPRFLRDKSLNDGVDRHGCVLRPELVTTRPDELLGILVMSAGCVARVAQWAGVSQKCQVSWSCGNASWMRARSASDDPAAAFRDHWFVRIQNSPANSIGSPLRTNHLMCGFGGGTAASAAANVGNP